MRAVILFTLVLAYTAGAQTPAKSISLSLRNAPLEEAFLQIHRQIGYEFIYTREQLRNALPVSVELRVAPLGRVLDACFKNQPFTYVLEGTYIAITARPGPSARTVTGKVLDENGSPLTGVTIKSQPAGRITTSNGQGYFSLGVEGPAAELLFSAVGYGPLRIPLQEKNYLEVTLPAVMTQMDEAIVIAYGRTTRLLNTGNITKIESAALADQPVTGVAAALEGRVPGMVVTQSSGVPGATFTMEVRGRTSLDPRLSQNTPLVFIDGLPFEAGPEAVNLLPSAANNPVSVSEGGLSALSFLSPQQIESIEVLKDADATAIYGSRGAGGVILISTRKATKGKLTLHTAFQKGWNHVTRLMPLLHTGDYVHMRREALEQDGLVPTAANAPDITLWDTTRYTDFAQLLIGHTARSADAWVQLQGGGHTTSFLLGGSSHGETTVFGDDFSYKRFNFQGQLDYCSVNKKLSLSVGTLFSKEQNNLVSYDPSRFLQLPPNLMLYDSSGALAWEEKGVAFSSINALNPLAQLNQRYLYSNTHLQATLHLNYLLGPGFRVIGQLGYHLFTLAEKEPQPRSSLPPNATDLPSSSFANSSTANWMAEPQLNFDHSFGKTKLEILCGATIQEKYYQAIILRASNYADDRLLNSLAAAGSVLSTPMYSCYRYGAIFGRVGLDYAGRYLLHLSGRRDGSSRFGPQRQFAVFGSGGAAWIFSREAFMRRRTGWLSFGKIRGSLGITGNDQIGDYKFYDLWSNTTNTYQGQQGLMPASLFNPFYGWEKNMKQELALELGFFRDRLTLSISLYRQRSSNGLVFQNLPVQAGFTSVIGNLDAVVQNSGVEILCQASALPARTVQWRIGLNLTIPHNRLLRFPQLDSSPYASTLVVGGPLSVIYSLKEQGVDPATGLYLFDDVNRDGKFTAADYQVLGHTDPSFYGGLESQLTFKGWQLHLVTQFVRQLGYNYLSNLYLTIPGKPYNQPAQVLQRWQRPGDISDVQRFSSLSGGLPNSAAIRLHASDGIYSDASFVRLKTASLSYCLPRDWIRKIHASEAKLYMQAQNLFTLTGYLGNDPENQRFFQVPPLRTLAGGIQLTF